jgi:hypothetical protein
MEGERTEDEMREKGRVGGGMGGKGELWKGK